MSFFDKDSSRQEGQPVFLFRFTQGDTSWLYSSVNTDIQIGSDIYRASSISIPGLAQSSVMSKNNIKLKLPRSDLFALRQFGYSGDQVTALTIFQYHSTDIDEEVATYWKGRVSGATADGSSISIECETIFTSMKKVGVREKFSKLCRHTHYDPRTCGVDPEDYAVEAQIMSRSGLQLQVPAAAGFDPGWFSFGFLRESTGEEWFIQNHSGSTILLGRQSKSLLERIDNAGYGLGYGLNYGGVGVTLFPGCDLLPGTCKIKYGNKPKYGGFQWMPLRTPMDGSSLV